MNKTLELIERRAKAWESAKAFLDTHTQPDGTVSAEDEAVYEKMEQEVIALGKTIDRLERQAAIDRALEAPTSRPILAKPETQNADDELST